MHICPKLMELLRAKGLTTSGGPWRIIPDIDIPKLQSMGVGGIFLPGSPMQDIVRFIQQHVRPQPEVV